MLDKEKYPTKRYLHFDHRVGIENAESYVTSPSRVAKHGFLPLIHYVASFEKNIGEKIQNLTIDRLSLKIEISCMLDIGIIIFISIMLKC